MDYRAASWEAVSYEELPWKRDMDELALIPKNRRRAISSTYSAAVPSLISQRPLTLPVELIERLGALIADVTRFDAEQGQRGYNLPALLLRSESSASSNIEHLTSSVRNVALAELSPNAPHNAQLIARNVSAMRRALEFDAPLSAEKICAINRIVTSDEADDEASYRQEQVWVGGTAYSPHGALFVPPAWERVPACVEDVLAFSQRNDVNPVAKAAVFHAQFETIHPFIDGNGRTGRTILHLMLRQDGVLSYALLPVSAGLLHDVDAYMRAIDSYQRGDLLPIIERMADALELALALGAKTAARIDRVVERWEIGITERAGSSIYRLPALLVEQPVVNADYLSRRLGITPRAARNLIERGCSYGMLRRTGTERRGVFYQADELIDVLEDISSVPGIRRILAGL